MSSSKYIISHTWDGNLCTPEEQITCSLSFKDNKLVFEFQAPFHNDPPPPPSSPKSLWGLWDFEVVEIFLVGHDGEYLEAEFGPHGHHLLLWLNAPREISKKHLPVDYTAKIQDNRWFGYAQIDRVHLPSPVHRFNIFAIHGTHEERRYLCYQALDTPKPDFHQPQRFPLLIKIPGLLP